MATPGKRTAPAFAWYIDGGRLANDELSKDITRPDRQEPMMPRKSPGHDSRMITYRTLPGSSTRYQRVNVGECTAWVQTNLEFDLEVQHPDQTTETKPYIIDTFCQHHGAVEPTLYLSPSGKWVRRVSFAELCGTKPKRAQYARNRQAPGVQTSRRSRRLTARNQHNFIAYLSKKEFYFLVTQWVARLCWRNPAYTLASK